MSCHVRGGDRDEFSDMRINYIGTLRIGNKSILVACLTKGLLNHDEEPKVDAILLDGTTI
jgi:hypothetical protein